LDLLPGVGVDEGAAPGAQYDAFLAQEADDDPLLAGAEIGLAVQAEDLLDTHPRRLFDLLVAVDEAPAELGGEAAADGGLAGAHHADENDGTGAEPGQQLVAKLFSLGSTGHGAFLGIGRR